MNRSFPPLLLGVPTTLAFLFSTQLSFAAPPEAAPADEAPVEEAPSSEPAPAEPAPAEPAPAEPAEPPRPMRRAAPEAPPAPPVAPPAHHHPHHPPPGALPPGHYPPPPEYGPPPGYGPEQGPPPGYAPEYGPAPYAPGGYAPYPPPPGYYAYPAPPEQPPDELPYEEGDPVPDGYQPVSRMRKGLVIAGSVVFGTTYLISVVTAAQVADVEGDAEEVWPLFVPIAGPFIAMGTTDAWGGADDGSSGLGAVLLLDGLAQVAGAAMFIGGVASTKTVLKRTATNDVQLDVQVRPNGVGLAGSF
jgi:hypothetical protein